MINNQSKDSSKSWGSINPRDESFNFDLWSKEVKLQMIKRLEEKLGSKILSI
jgi:hypothetical protein